LAAIASSTEIGSLGIFHLKRMWSAAIAERNGARALRPDEAGMDQMVIYALGFSHQQLFQYLYFNAPSFSEFEEWIAATAGRPDPLQVERINADLTRAPRPAAVRAWLESIDESEPALSAEDLRFWDENGYVILRNAVPEATRAAAERTIWEHVGADPDSPDSWYAVSGSTIHGIMVELIRNEALDANRRVARIHKAFAQLWGTSDLWVSTDRCGFHPPQREGHPFPGPDLHWDLDFSLPPALGTQGILYLTDTPPEQGALTLVPGFHRRMAAWLETLAPGSDPQKEDLHALGSFPVGANAGDMVIWHHHLPHGSRPNLGKRPRIVQYITMFPGPKIA
jgi:hypothetical protein